MISHPLLCRVQALYPFESNDPSSLKFEVGDYIDVLAKLPSGWWDGWCNGNRGWFPSNYVKIVDDYSNTELVERSPRQSSTQADLFDDKVGENQIESNKRASLPPNWSIQHKEDGSASYYFNTLTGEMRSTYPCDESNFYYDDDGESYEDGSVTSSITSSCSNNSRSDLILLDLGFIPTSDDSSEQSLNDSKWIQRSTPQGLPYFYNLSTHETAWHADSQQDKKTQQQKRSKNRSSLYFQPSHSVIDSNEKLTWNKISIHITLTINNLIASAKASQRSLYKKYAANVVEAIRFMLIASGTISKESTHIKSNNMLRSHHRAIMASLSKLVLSAQLLSANNEDLNITNTNICSDSSTSKLLSDCHELLVAVRNFTSTCENIPVELHHINPTIVSLPTNNNNNSCSNSSSKEDGRRASWQDTIPRQNLISSTTAGPLSIVGSNHGQQGDNSIGRAKYALQTDLIENLDAYGASMQESMESLMANLTRHSDSRCSLAVLLFTQYRNFGNQNGQFLSIIEDIDFDGVIHSPFMKQLAIAKQQLYDGLGSLFFKMQIMTDESVSMDKVILEMQDAAQSIISAIQAICKHMADLVVEKNRLASQNEGEGEETMGNKSTAENVSVDPIHPTSSSSSSSAANTNSISDFLFSGNSLGNNDFLSLDLSLPNYNNSNDTSKNGKRSQSLSAESNHNSAGSINAKNQQRPMSMKLIHRASAPHTSGNSTPLTLGNEVAKLRSHTSTDVQVKHTSAKLKQFFGDDLPDTPTTINGIDPLGGEPTTTTSAEAEATGGTGFNSGQGGRKTSMTPSVDVSSATAAILQEDEQRFLKYDYSPNEIVFTLEGSVKGGTLRALVERMTLHDYLDLNFNSTFLLTYRSFCTSIEVLELLEARYNIQPPADLTPEELEIWANKKQKLVRLRVFNVLKIWLEQYYYEEDSVILDRLLHFTNTSIKQTLSFSAYQLERLIQKRKEASQGMLLKKLVNTQPHDLPEPILPRNLKKFRLLDLDPMEMARQLTLMDFKLYNSIKPVECLDKAWSRDAASSSSSSASTAVTAVTDEQQQQQQQTSHTHIAVNIQASIDYCNQVTTWVSDEILSQSEVKKRSMLIKYWVNVAERCRVYNNFNTCMAILSAFDNSAVGRLKRTWEMVGARTNHIVAHMRKLMGANRNFNQYRALIHSVNPPCIPFLGIYLQDLTFIEDGNPNFLKTSKDLINFAKRAKTAEVIREIQQYQTMGYHFRPVEEIQTFITENLHSSRDEDQLYKESLKLEPKERDDEKITRLLQESGFL